jgi:hypothetical protein
VDADDTALANKYQLARIWITYPLKLRVLLLEHKSLRPARRKEPGDTRQNMPRKICFSFQIDHPSI